jgi:SAM-dependent methyltransferase
MITGTKTKTEGSAKVQSAAWGVRARDWAEMEGNAINLYERVLLRLKIDRRTSLLDVGCGTGFFCKLAADNEAIVTGFDATPPFIEIAKERVPEGTFVVGDMEELPFAENMFDTVTGFNSFQFAANTQNALSEAYRVLKPNGKFSITVWGKPEDSDAAGYFDSLRELMPPMPPDAPGPFALSEDGVLEKLVRDSGFTPVRTEYADSIWYFPDETTVLKRFLAPAPAFMAINHSGENKVREAVMKAIEPFKTRKGSYYLKNKFKFTIAKKSN